MRILGAVFSLLAGKLKNFELLLTRRFFQKKIGACVFWRPYFFLSFLAGKLKNFKQMLTRSIFFFEKKNWRMRILAPVFFLSLLAGKLKIFKRSLYVKDLSKKFHFRLSNQKNYNW